MRGRDKLGLGQMASFVLGLLRTTTAAGWRTALGVDAAGSGGAVTSVFGRAGVVAATAGDYTAADITNVPAGAIAAITVQAAINELDTEKCSTGDSRLSDVRRTTGADGAFDLAGVITPAQIVANTDDYNPTGLSAASTIRVSTDASRNITGLAGGAAGRIIVIQNVGGFDVVLKNETTSTAANRFSLGADLTLATLGCAVLQYDATSSRWRCIGASRSSSGGAAGGSNTQVQFNNSGAFGGITNATTDGTTLTLTSPKIVTNLKDTNGNVLLGVTATASAVNNLGIKNYSNVNGVGEIYAEGSNADIDIYLTGKGTTKVRAVGGVTDNDQWRIKSNSFRAGYMDVTNPSAGAGAGVRGTNLQATTAVEVGDNAAGISMGYSTNLTTVVINGSSGFKIGSATTQKIGLWNVTPVVQPSSTGEATGYTGGGGTALTHTDTFTGNSGTKAYTLNDIVKHLKAVGILAAS